MSAELREYAQQYDALKVSMKQRALAQAVDSKKCKALEPYLEKLLEKLNGDSPYQKVGKKGVEVSKPLLLPSSYVAQLNTRNKRPSMNKDNVEDAVSAWLSSNGAISVQNLDEFLEFLDLFLDSKSERVTSIKYRKAKKSENPTDESDQPPKPKKRKLVNTDTDLSTPISL